MAPTTIELDLNKKYQTIDGFGYAITYSSCYNLMQMTPEARQALLKRIYSTTEGYGVSYARISFGMQWLFKYWVYLLRHEVQGESDHQQLRAL